MACIPSDIAGCFDFAKKLLLQFRQLHLSVSQIEPSAMNNSRRREVRDFAGARRPLDRRKASAAKALALADSVAVARQAIAEVS